MMLAWVQQQRSAQQPIPLAVFKSKAIRVYRDLKYESNFNPEIIDQLGTLNADRKWFMSFLERHPVRYDNMLETMVTVMETRRGNAPPDRFMVRKSDLQFIFDESGESSDDDDDVILVVPETPANPPPPVLKTYTKAVPCKPLPPQRKRTVAMKSTATATTAPKASPSPSPVPSPATQKPPQMPPRLAAVQAKKPAEPPAPPASRVSRAAVLAAKQRATVKVPPPKLRAAPKAAPPPPVTGDSDISAIPLARLKKVKTVSRGVQVELADQKDRVFKPDHMTVNRKIAVTQKLKAVKSFIAERDKCAARQKVVQQMLEQLIGFYNVDQVLVKRHEEKAKRRIQKMKEAKAKQKQAKLAAELVSRVKRERRRSPSPPPISRRGVPMLNGDAATLVHCELGAEDEEAAVPPEEEVVVVKTETPRVRVKREPVERPPVRIKLEKIDKDLLPVVRIKRERLEAHVTPEKRIKRERLEVPQFPVIAEVNGGVEMPAEEQMDVDRPEGGEGE